jgi:biopolymer transport protein ExbD
MANINIINFKKWDDQFLARNPQRKCNFNIVKSSVYDEIYYGKHFEFKAIYYYLNPLGREEIILDKKIISFEQLGISIQDYNLENDPPTENIPVYLDIEIKWEQYHRLRELLYKKQVKSILLMVYDPQQIYPFSEHYEKVIKYRISDYLFHSMNEEALKNELQKISNLIQITNTDKPTYQINGSNIPSDSLHNRLKRMIQHDSNYLIHYKFQKDISFGAYFKLFVIMKEVLFELNTNQSIDSNNLELYQSSQDQKRIPFLIYEDVLKK